MVQRRSGARLSPKTLQGGCVASKLFGKELQCCIATQLQVLRLVHNTHTPLPILRRMR